MRVNNQSSSLHLLKLAFQQAKFNPRRMLTTLLLILLFTAGSLYITKQIYQDKLKLFPTDKTELTKDEQKQPASVNESLHQPQILRVPLKLRQEHKRKAVAQLKSQLQASALGKLKESTRGGKRRGLGKREAEKLARHQSILTHDDEVAELRLQDQELYSEEVFDSLPPDEEDITPPPSKQKPGFWSGLRKDFYSVLKEILRKLI